jgi:glycosyltransferase involved in cell wall biosynthesis
MGPLKICIVNEIANCGYHLAKGLARMGHEVEVILDAKKKRRSQFLFSQETPPGVRLHWVKERTSLLSTPLQAGEIFRHIRSFRPDIIHVNYLWTHFFVSVASGTLLGIPTVGVAHGWDILDVPRDPWRKLFLGLFLPNAERLVLTAKYFPRIAEAVPLERQVYIPRSIDAERFRPGIGCGDFRQRFGENMVTSIARLRHTKALDKLVRAFRSVVDEVQDAQLLLVGEGPEKQNLLHLRDELDLLENVKFLGLMLNTEMPRFLNASKVEAHGFAMPALGISHLEAMACGTPVVTYTGEESCEGVVSAFDEDEIAEGITKVLTSPVHAKRLGRRAREFVIAEYGLEAHTKKYLKVYRDILDLRR